MGELTGCREERWDVAGLQALLAGLEGKYGRNTKRLIERSQIFINDEIVQDHHDRLLADGDVLSFVPPAAGG